VGLEHLIEIDLKSSCQAGSFRKISCQVAKLAALRRTAAKLPALRRTAANLQEQLPICSLPLNSIWPFTIDVNINSAKNV